MDGDLTLVFTGDLAPMRPLSGERDGSREVWDYLRSADLAMVNLELPLTDADAPADKAITLRADPGIAPSIRQAGVDAATVANNHALDYGPEGLLDTLGALERADIAATGGGETLEEALRPATLSAGGQTVAVFGLASTLPPGYAASTRRPVIAPVRVRSRFLVDSVTLDEQPGMSPWVETEAVEEDVGHACRKISDIRSEVDLIVVQVHWGIPHGWCAAFQGPLADYQRPVGHALVEAGADLIVGHHSHTVHGAELHDRGFIAYSLGNFLFHSMGADERLIVAENNPPYDLESLQTGEALETVLMEVRVKSGRPRRVRFLPGAMDEHGEPRFLSGGEARAVLNRLEGRSSRLGTSVEIGDGEAMVHL